MPPAVDPQPWPAPAKINRFLHILSRRDDGMHELQTVFQFVNLCDQLYFTLRDDGGIHHLTPLPGISVETDLTIRAARALQDATGCRLGVDLRIDKRLPAGGGLGGGSSDAATTLVALNRLWRLNLPADQLAGIAIKLGADVPVFVRGQAAWAEGIGERLTPIRLDEPWFLVVRPDCEVVTGRVFAAPGLTRNTPPTTIRDFLQGSPGSFGNDCEAVVRALFPAVAEALDWLQQRAPARLTGTGACLFAAFANVAEARAVAAQLPDRWQGFIGRGLNESPLLTRLKQELG